MYMEGSQVADSEKRFGEHFHSVSIAYFIIDDSPLLNFSTFPNTIPLATYLCLWSDKQWEEAPEK